MNSVHPRKNKLGTGIPSPRSAFWFYWKYLSSDSLCIWNRSRRVRTSDKILLQISFLMRFVIISCFELNKSMIKRKCDNEICTWITLHLSQWFDHLKCNWSKLKFDFSEFNFWFVFEFKVKWNNLTQSISLFQFTLQFICWKPIIPFTNF